MTIILWLHNIHKPDWMQTQERLRNIKNRNSILKRIITIYMLSIFLNRSKSISLKTVFYVNELILKQPQALCIGLIKNLKPLVSTVCNDDEFHSSRYPNLFRDAKASENLNYIVDVKRRFGFIFTLFLTVERIKTKDILK